MITACKSVFLTIFVVSVVGASRSAEASPLPPVVTPAEFCLTAGFSSECGNAALSRLTYDATVNNVHLQAGASNRLTPVPLVSADASASPQGETPASANTAAGSYLSYEVVLWQIRTMSQPVVIPVDVYVSAFAAVSGNASSALAGFRIGPYSNAVSGKCDEGGCSQGPDISQTYAFALRLDPDTLYEFHWDVVMQAAASAVGTARPNEDLVYGSAIATVDPAFRLNQAAFDEWAVLNGVEPFPLTDYFQFLYSPELRGPAAIPEPGSPGLLMIGCVLLLLCRRYLSDRAGVAVVVHPWPIGGYRESDHPPPSR
jgi:hypothetical protein